MISTAPDESWSSFQPVMVTSSASDYENMSFHQMQPFPRSSGANLTESYTVPTTTTTTTTTTTALGVPDSAFDVSEAVLYSNRGAFLSDSANETKSSTTNTTTTTSMDHMDAPRIYPLLFAAATESPPFHESLRSWWEENSRLILWSFDTREISLVIRHSLFRNSNEPREILLSRYGDLLDRFLGDLFSSFGSQLVPGMSQAQKVEEILRICQPPQSLLNLRWSWYPSLGFGKGLGDDDPAVIADGIDAESQMHFKGVSFEAWVRCSLGFPSNEADWFFLQHNVLYVLLLNHLQAYQSDIPKYREVEKLLREKSPFAHKAVEQCLNQFSKGKEVQSPRPTTQFGLEFIAGPIQDLFKDYSTPIISLLKKLSVVAIRFQETYIHVPSIDWKKRLDTRAKYLDDLLAALSPADLARSLTRSDQTMFASLSREKFVSEQDPIVETLHTRWSDLAVSVRDCCTALPEFVPFIQDCIKILSGMRNYNSALALVQGLETLSIKFMGFSSSSTSSTTSNNHPAAITVSLTPREISSLSDSSNNYAAYRHAMKVAPGIPFLLPHIIEYRQRGEKALEELFTTS